MLRSTQHRSDWEVLVDVLTRLQQRLLFGQPVEV